MSLWYEPKLEDMNLSADGLELDVHIGDDESGAIYVSLKVADLQAALTKLTETRQ